MSRKGRRKNRVSVLKSLNEVNTSKAKSTHIFAIMLIIVLIAGLMIGFVWQKVKISHLVIEIEELRKQEQMLKERNEKKKAIVLSLLNDSRIIKIAKNDLKMIFPPYEVVQLPDNYVSQQKMIDQILAQSN